MDTSYGPVYRDYSGLRQDTTKDGLDGNTTEYAIFSSKV